MFISLLFTTFLSAGFAFTEQPTQIQSFDNAVLNGAWTIPATEPQAAILILQGSGNVDLDGDVSGPFLGHGYKGLSPKLSAQLAHALAESGIASLRYSKRGVDDATQLINQTMPYLIKDAQAALNMVNVKFIGKKIAIIGASEGALIASTLATTNPLSALFLMGTPTRSIDNILSYQFVEWPVSLAQQRLDVNHDGILDTAELGSVKFPMLGAGFGAAEWTALDANKDGMLSIVDEIIPAYQGFHGAILEFVRTQLGPWYKSMQELPTFTSVASQITTPTFLYHGMNDAQVKWSWIATDSASFAGPKTLRLFANLGHCFSPMEGSYGEDKTSGPFDDVVVRTLINDVTAALK